MLSKLVGAEILNCLLIITTNLAELMIVGYQNVLLLVFDLIITDLYMFLS